MAAGDLALRILITASGSQALAELGAVNRAVRGFGTGIRGIGVAALVAGAGIAALGIASVKASGDFQQQMLHMEALAGVGHDQMIAMGNDILAMAPKVGQMPVDMAKAMFQIVSSLVPANQQLNALYYSSILASTGMANIVDVAKVMSTIMKIYGMNAATAANDMTVAVTMGRMTMTDYANSIGLVVQKGRAAGFSFNELNAALDVLTTHAFPSSQQAARNLGQLFVQMDLGMDALTKRAQSMGLSFDENKFKTMGLSEQIAYLNKVTGGNAAELHKLIGGGVYAFQTFEALSNGAADYATILGKLKDANNGVGAAEAAWGVTQQGFNVELEKAKAGIQVLMITIGNFLLPVLGSFLGKIGELVGSFAAWLNSGTAVNDTLSLTGKYAQIVLPLLAGLGALLLSIIIPALWSMAKAMFMNPITWLVLGVVLLTAAFVHFYQTNAGFKQFIDWSVSGLQQLWATLQANVLPAIQQFGDWLGKNVLPPLQQVGSYIQANFVPALQAIGTFLSQNVLPPLQKFGNWLGQYVLAPLVQLGSYVQANFAPAMQTIGTYLSQKVLPPLQQIGTYFQQVGSYIQANFVPAMQSLGAFLDKNVLPPLQQLGAFIQGSVLPQLLRFGTFLVQNVLPSLLQLAAFIIVNFVPALQAMGSYFQGHIWPLLQEIGSFLADVFVPVWQQLVEEWNNIILPSLKQLWGALQPLMPLLKGLAMIVGGLLILALGLLVGIIAALIRGFAGLLAGFMIVWAGIIQFVTGVVQLVSGFVTLIYDLITFNWGKIGSDLGMIWQGILNMFGGFFHAVGGMFYAFGAMVVGIVIGLVQGVIFFFRDLFDKLVGHSIIPDMINGIINWFLSLPGKVPGIIGTMISGVINGLTTFAGQAGTAIQNGVNTITTTLGNSVGAMTTAGLNIVKGIANGIISGITTFVGGAMSQLGGFIHDHLPHSPAKMGPLRDLALQGSLIPNEIATGMQKGMPQVQSKLNMMLNPMGLASRGNIFAIPANPNANQGTMNMTINLDGKQITNAVGVRLAKEMRIQGGVRSV